MTVHADDLRNAPSRNPVVPAGNTATGLLKLIALLFMLIDHSGKVLFNNCTEMRILGRIAFPIYVWCMIVGFWRTRSVLKYLLRILLVGALSQPLYVLALDNNGHVGEVIRQFTEPLASGFSFAGLWQVIADVYNKPNIFLTLFLGLAALWGIRERKFLSWLWAPAAAIILATVLNTDYGWRGIVFMILLYAVRGSRSGIAAVMIAFFMYWGTGYTLTSRLFGWSFRVSDLPPSVAQPLSALMRMETYALLSMPFILCRFPRDVRLPKWLGYGVYPAHLLLLIILKLIVFR